MSAVLLEVSQGKLCHTTDVSLNIPVTAAAATLLTVNNLAVTGLQLGTFTSTVAKTKE